MINNQEFIEEIIKSPLTLLAIKDKEIIKQVNNYLPYSIGMEFECYKKDTYNKQDFLDIPDIMDIIVDNSEQRYRIPNGINGFICLYNICNQLIKHSKLDLGSSVHFHIDMTDCFNEITKKFQIDNNNWIIEELKTWGTAINLSYATYGSWYKFNDLKTLEIRIGEPSFDYKILINRIIQASKIGIKIKDLLGVEYKEIESKPLDTKLLIDYINKNSVHFNYKNLLNELDNKLKELKPKENKDSISEYLDKIKSITNNRTVIINKEHNINNQ